MSNKLHAILKFESVVKITIVCAHVFCSRTDQQQANAAAAKMLFAISGVFLVCNISISIIAFGISYLGSNQDHLTAAGLLLLDVLILLYPAAVLANSCANFPLLLLTMGSFRKTLKKILKLQK